MAQTPSPADLLRSADEETRREAFDRISVEMDDDLAREILGIVRSGAAEEVRADAIVALGPAVDECGVEYVDDEEVESSEYGAPLSRDAFVEVTDALRELYDDERQPKLVRRRAFEVLVRDPQPWQQDAIRRDFRSGDRDWKMTAIFSMGYVRGFEKELVDQLRTASGDLLYEAVRSAGRAEVQEAAAIIEGLAISEDADRDVRLEAIAALPSVDPDCFDLLDELSESQDEQVRAAAEEALEELQMMDEDLGDEEDDDL
jgi:uncharacterized protein (UPF0147 family)